MRDRRRQVALAVTLAATMLVAACAGREIPGSAQPTGDMDPGNVAGLPVTTGPSGIRNGVPDAQLQVRNVAGTDMDRLAEDGLSDIFDYWRQTMPQAFDHQFTPPKKLTSYDANGTPVTVCGQSSQGIVNAFYCPTDDSVSWDRGTLLPALSKMFGQLAVVTVFAHEMGHAVQFQLKSVDENTPTIVKEQQADCYAGAFIRWMAEGHSQHFQISTGDGLNQVLAAMMFVRDPVGYASADPGAHGNAFDRVTAFQFGFSSGPQRCNKIDYKEIRQRITELGFASAEQQSNDNVPVDETTLPLLQQGLDAAFKRSDAEPPKIVSGDGNCAQGGGTPPASYCAQDNTVVIDEAALNKLAVLPKGNQLRLSDTALGDFAAFAEIASRYALGVQKSLGIPLEDANAGLRTACLTGAWAGVARHRISDGPQQQLLLGPGDLDEGVAELLTPHSLIAADVTGKRVPAGFARVSAFQIGFLQGSKDCTTRFN